MERRLTRQLEHLHTLPALVLAHEAHPARRKALDERRVHLVPMTMALPDLARAAIQLAHLRPPRRVLLEHGRAQAQAHRAAHVRLRDLGHEHDHGLWGGGVELGGRRAREAAHVARPLNDGELEAEADAEEGLLLFARPLDGEHHAFGAAHTEAAGDEDTAGGLVSGGALGMMVGTYFAETTSRHASWYLAGLVCCASGSRSEASTH